MGVKMGRRFAFVVLAIIWSGTWAANPQTLDQQEKCAAQARKTYQEDTYKERVESQRLGVPEPMSSDYQSHYNTKLNRCLIEAGASADEHEHLLKLGRAELGRDLVYGALMEQQDSRDHVFVNALGGGPTRILRMKIETEASRHSAGRYTGCGPKAPARRLAPTVRSADRLGTARSRSIATVHLMLSIWRLPPGDRVVTGWKSAGSFGCGGEGDITPRLPDVA
jgi:hypothetical protein